MRTRPWLAAAVFLAAGAGASAEAGEAPPRSAVAGFLRAADGGDRAAMAALLKGDVGRMGGGRLSPAKFLQSLDDCYLRRVYSDGGASGAVLAAWMCVRSRNGMKSAVVMVRLAEDSGGLHLSDYDVRESAMSAPPRKGSALSGT